MAIKLKLEAKTRDRAGKGAARKLRMLGETPAIIYGNNKDNMPISFNTREFLKIVHGEAHENMIFQIDFNGGSSKNPHNVVIKEMQFDPVKGSILHVDFYEISMDHMLEVHVPIEIIGESVGVKDEGGLLDHSLRELLVKCLPNDLPEKIEVDVTPLKLGESLHIKEIALPPGVTIIENPEKVVLSIIHKLKVKVEVAAEVTEEVVEPEVLSQKGTPKEETK